MASDSIDILNSAASKRAFISDSHRDARLPPYSPPWSETQRDHPRRNRESVASAVMGSSSQGRIETWKLPHDLGQAIKRDAVELIALHDLELLATI